MNQNRKVASIITITNMLGGILATAEGVAFNPVGTPTPRVGS
ncbi:hypothetical protein [Mycolicibacterium baixiangningiae]|nr:hypothetical protein [Mycolicibacterium baixiangningiae]